MSQTDRQIAVVVLGAGRSGTSAITSGVQAIGVQLGPGLRPGGGKNPTGFFEDEELLALNKRLKQILDIRGTSVRLIGDTEWQRQEVLALGGEAIQTVRRRFGSFPLWGYKYARTLRLLPFWLDVYRNCNLDDRYVMALRNPMSVARSREKLDPRRGTQEKSDLEWLVNVVPYFRRIRERPFVVVDYDLLMEQPAAQLERMAQGLSLRIDSTGRKSMREYAEEFLRPGLRHTRFSEADLELDPRLNALTRRAYLWLYRLAVEQTHASDPRIWEEWETIEHGVRDLAPVLRHVDQVESALRRAQRHPLGPLQLAPQLWRRLRGA